MQGLISFYLTGFTIAAVVVAYMLPTLVAWLRHTPDLAAVAVINIALGWTFVGWVVALAMAVQKKTTPAIQVIGQVNTSTQPPPDWPRSEPPPRREL
jgi:hypothetical protein